MRLRFCLTICLLHIVLYATASTGKYTIIAPGSIYSNEIYTVSVALHHTSQPCHIKVGITGPSYNVIQKVEVAQYEVKYIDFITPSLEDDSYSLTAEAVGCLENFQNTTELFYEKSNKQSIITDKGLYKPGDDINFRVLFMDRDMKPVKPLDGAQIEIRDGDYNLVKEIKNFKTIQGVYTGKFTIPEHTVAGEWTLYVENSDDSSSTAYFMVDDKYIVNVKAAGAVSVKDGDMQVLVTANHVSGEPVDGEVNVVLSLENKETPNPDPSRLNKTVNLVDGKAKIDFNIKDDFSKYTSPYRTTIQIAATVKEQFTGVTVEATATTYNYPFRYTMSCVRMNTKSCLFFEGGKENNLLFRIIHANGTYASDTKSIIEFTYSEVLRKDFRQRGFINTKNAPISQNRTVTYKGYMNETGYIGFNVLLPELAKYEGYLHYYALKYKYLDEERHILYTYQNRKLKNAAKKYFYLADESVSDNTLQINKPHQFTVKSSQPLSYFVYNVIGHRNIVRSGRIELPDKPTRYNLNLTPEASWGLKFHLYVFYVDENGELHHAEKRYRISTPLNPITINAVKQVKPGELAITIKTTPNSFVGLMAVDQRALLINENGDLKPSRLEKLFDEFGTFTVPQGGYSYYPGTISGCVTLTNANYPYNWETVAPKPNIGNYGDGLVNRKSPVTKAVAVKSPPPPQGVAEFVAVGAPSGTKHIGNKPKTWIFADIQNTTSAEFTWSTNVTDTKTTWVLTAFSFNPSTGLGVTDHATKITVV